MEMKSKLEQHIMYLILENLENKENSYENLLKFINSLWEIRKQLKEDIISYSMHFNLYQHFNGDLSSRQKFIKLSTDTYDIFIDLENKIIKIHVNLIENYKECIIKTENKLSNELSNFLCDFYFDNSIKLDLSKLTEEYSVSKKDMGYM